MLKKPTNNNNTEKDEHLAVDLGLSVKWASFVEDGDDSLFEAYVLLIEHQIYYSSIGTAPFFQGMSIRPVKNY